MKLRSREVKISLLLECEIEEMEKLKAPLKYCSFIIQIPKRRKRKSWEVSQIVIRRDQSALNTTVAKCSPFPWHFCLRKHFTAVLCLQDKDRERVTENR